MTSTAVLSASATTETKTALHVETKPDAEDASRASLPKKRPMVRLFASSSTLSDESGAEGIPGPTLVNVESNSSLPFLPTGRGSSDVVSNHNTYRQNPSRSSSNGDETDYGLLISINNDGQCQVQFCADANYRQIHPNVYAPDALQDVKKLGGGGSGVAVFSGRHPELGSVVMKHGGYKDMIELFALAQISEELNLRGGGDGNAAASAASAAALDMQQRIPEFKMIYASPYHFRERGAAFWGSLKEIIKSWSLFSLHGAADGDGPACTPIEVTSKMRFSSVGSINEGLDENTNNNDKSRTRKSIDLPDPSRLPSLGGNGLRDYRSSSVGSNGIFFRRTSLTNSDRGPGKSRGQPPPPSPIVNGVRPSVIIRKMNPHGLNFGKSIRIYESDGFDEDSDNDHGNVSFQLDSNCASVALVFNKESCDFLNDGRTVVIHGSSYDGLKSIVDELLPLMTDQLFKFTLGQKAIGEVGGSSPSTGNQLLYAGKLHGPLLETLISQFIEVIRNLRQLTLPEEVDVVDFVRDEVTRLEEGYREDDDGNIEALDASDISKVSDSFVGNAIKKNFHPVKGRSRLLEVLGKSFRERPSDLILTPEEELPAFHLGRLLRSGALMGDTFEDVFMDGCILQPDQYYWRNVLRRAVEDRPGRSSAAFERIWTCGLTDAGIHNLFLSDDKVWFFDLGEPQLQSIPGFMTKFLFSFLHTLGMEEDENPLEPNNPDKSWVRRFVTIEGCNKLALTGETKQLLPKAYNALEVCLDRIIEQVFDGDDGIRWLLLQYITLQLMSDAGFCLTRWQVKGGGRERNLNHNKSGLEKWLWRALWDIYVAYDINTKESWTRFGIEHPSQC